MPDKKYYTIEEAAQRLGITASEVNLLRERHELHGYRDGVNWRFKVEDVEELAGKRRLQEKLASAEAGEETGDVLVSEVALGGSDAGVSGTVIGADQKGPSDSDLRLADSELKLAAEAPAPSVSDTGTVITPTDAGMGPGEQVVLDQTISLEEEQAPALAPAADSAVDLDAAGKRLDDDNVVLGGSGSGSDITIGGDSGISLVDPTDSGLSLEEPLELERAEDDSLELGEDDMLTFAEESSTEAPTELKPDEEFMLTPLEEAPEEESESGSQVIALDTGPPSEAATMLAAGPAPAAAMLDEELSAAAGVGLAPEPAAAPLAAVPTGLAEAGPAVGPAPAALPEAPYTGLNIAALGLCLVLLILGGMMVYDLLRNMWSWDRPFTINSAIMDLIVGRPPGR
ncbi:MAG: helix-turn-helix domain-containing protein [Thermoguttaceae bacterium]